MSSHFVNLSLRQCAQICFLQETVNQIISTGFVMVRSRNRVSEYGFKWLTIWPGDEMTWHRSAIYWLTNLKARVNLKNQPGVHDAVIKCTYLIFITIFI
jgi:hypothetical protein